MPLDKTSRKWSKVWGKNTYSSDSFHKHCQKEMLASTGTMKLILQYRDRKWNLKDIFKIKRITVNEHHQHLPLAIVKYAEHTTKRKNTGGRHQLHHALGHQRRPTLPFNRRITDQQRNTNKTHKAMSLKYDFNLCCLLPIPQRSYEIFKITRALTWKYAHVWQGPSKVGQTGWCFRQELKLTLLLNWETFSTTNILVFKLK